MTNQLATLGAFRFTLLAALAILTPRAGTAQATSYQVIRSFRGDPDGAQPMGAVVIGKDGALYGTTELGGTSKTGTVFKLAPVTATSWKETVLHSFAGPPDGLYPQATLAFGEGGLLDRDSLVRFRLSRQPHAGCNSEWRSAYWSTWRALRHNPGRGRRVWQRDGNRVGAPRDAGRRLDGGQTIYLWLQLGVSSPRGRSVRRRIVVRDQFLRRRMNLAATLATMAAALSTS